jgi:CheY-like chemotaxis protein
MGCQVSIATNGAEAVANCLTKFFDLILMDYHLPEMDGVQATKIIRNRMKDRHVPIIAMSASVLDEDRALFHEAGMDGLVTKPIRLEEIERVITNHVLNKNGNTDTSSRITPSPNP